MSRNRNGFVGGIVALVVIVIGLIVFFTGMTKVPAGYVGIVYNYRTGISGETVSQGWHWTGPMKDVILYSVGIEQSYLTSNKDGDSPNDDSFEVPTSDGKGLKVDLTFTYRFDADKVTEIFSRFKGRDGKEVREEFIRPNIISWVKEVTAQYPVTEILGEQRANLNIAVSDYVKEKFAPYGIIVENTSLINIDADEETRAQVQKRVNAIQELELAQTEKKTAKVKADQEKEVALTKAEQEREVASIEAEQKVIKANADAEATRIKAQAQADANKAIAESLTQELIQKSLIDKWSGDVPRITSGDSGLTSILNIKNLE